MMTVSVLNRFMACASVMAIATAAAAQTPAPAEGAAGPANQMPAPGAATAPPGSAPQSADSPSSKVSEVVVTGSRVLKNGNASPTPVTIVSPEILQNLQPGPVAESLATLPVFAGSRTSTSNPGSGVSNTAANELNLRNLNYNRTLVLYDGQRIAPSTYDQIVDIDSIPQMLLERVDVVTGGTSAVYGSDAVAGVVNFITDTKFNGIKMNVSGGTSSYGDDDTIDTGVAVGTPVLDGRGHVELSYEYRNDPGIAYRTDRQFGRDYYTEQGANTLASPEHLVSNTRFANYTFGGLISGAPTATGLNGQTFAQNGVLSPFVAGIPTGVAAYQSGGSGAYNDASLKSALLSNQMFGRFDYNFTDDIKGFVEFSDTINHTLTHAGYNYVTKDVISGQNAFLPAQYRFAGTANLSEYLSDMGRIDTNTHENQYVVTSGVNGRFSSVGGDYHWDVVYSHSASDLTARNDNNINNSHLSAALDAVTSPTTGQTVCRASLTNAAYANCVPLNLFGPTAASKAALAYITTPTQFEVNNGLDTISTSISGSPISTWAGPIQTALSGEFRRESFSVDSDAQPTDYANCAGLTYNCTQGTTLAYADATLGSRTPVSETVAEAAIETEIPLMKDLPFAKDVSFNGAARFTDYSASGKAWTWKVGLVWAINDDLKLRATRSRDIRAPTLYDLYQPKGQTLGNNLDLLTGTNGPSLTVTEGNPNLKPEVGSTTTGGFIYTPHWLPRFSFSMDAYYIKISDAIEVQTGSGTTDQQFCYASGGTSSFCQLIIRPGPITDTSASNAATEFLSEELNVAEVKTYGADFEANYLATVLNNPLSLRAFVTYQPHYLTYNPGQPTIEGAGSAYASIGPSGNFPIPRVRVSLFADYKVQNFDLALEERWRSELSYVNGPGQIYSGSSAIVPIAYTNATLTYKLRTASYGSTEIYFNVQNLFNAQPPAIAGASQAAQLGVFGGYALSDDPVGRYLTLGLRYRH